MTVKLSIEGGNHAKARIEKSFLSAVCIAIFGFHGISFASDVSGFWKGRMLETRNQKNSVPIELMLSQTGHDLKGTLTMHTNDGDIDLSLLGLIDGNNYSLKSTATQLMGGMASERISFKGTADGQQIVGDGTMTIEAMMGSQVMPIKIEVARNRN